MTVAAPALAGVAEFSQTFTDAGSAGGFGDLENSVFTFTYDGTDFLLGDIDVTATAVNQGDPLADPASNGNWVSDAIIDISRIDLNPDVDWVVIGASSAENIASDTFEDPGQDLGPSKASRR